MRTRALKWLLIPVLCWPCLGAVGKKMADFQAFLVRKIPPRPPSAMTGSQFAKRVSGMDGSPREQAILAQLEMGNLPDFLRKLKPVTLVQELDGGKTTTITIFVMPDYLAIGSNKDFLSIPMGLHTAAHVANRFGFILPTKKMVDAIFEQSAFHFTPEPMPWGPQMRSTSYYWTHHRRIATQRLALRCPLGALISGHKKDVVLTNRLVGNPGKIAIYGWHRLSGDPIQPLSTVHGAGYADYSHGIRLVSDIVLLDGEPWSICRVLEDPGFAAVLSDEGPIHDVQELMAVRHDEPVEVHKPPDSSRSLTFRRTWIPQESAIPQ